mmetsp:Transcript_29838/g.84037  ORF Transcript_29838/g.84037 Transcript_29838/m.84037 type:complete len:294 (+) Transcript_29838:219-1100(+)
MYAASFGAQASFVLPRTHAAMYSHLSGLMRPPTLHSSCRGQERQGTLRPGRSPCASFRNLGTRPAKMSNSPSDCCTWKNDSPSAFSFMRITSSSARLVQISLVWPRLMDVCPGWSFRNSWMSWSLQVFLLSVRNRRHCRRSVSIRRVSISPFWYQLPPETSIAGFTSQSMYILWFLTDLTSLISSRRTSSFATLVMMVVGSLLSSFRSFVQMPWSADFWMSCRMKRCSLSRPRVFLEVYWSIARKRGRPLTSEMLRRPWSESRFMACTISLSLNPQLCRSFCVTPPGLSVQNL